ncbi:MAG: CHAT domain-containing protein [Ardenticatenaceae bacterium]|nr:CHAT domain-containing protein [Anaerolineales bacterium]MCB8923329.1 CHAT domain-containing protein [Ardenticatenaceae bacterium]MCB9004671.1 CHAT domain-containing protein [Ardenticatenaceae bacterium]
MADHNFEAAQILHWANEDEAFRKRLFADLPGTLDALRAAGFEVSDRAAEILQRVNAANFSDYYQRVSGRFSPEQLQTPLLHLAGAGNEMVVETITAKEFADWLNDDQALRELFFNDAGNAFKAAESAGYTLPIEDQQRLQILTRSNFDQKIKELTTRATAKRPLPDTLETPSERIVNTGFAAQSAPTQDLPAEKPLPTASDCYFWFEVGARIAGSIEKEAVALPTEKLPSNVQLHVVLFDFADELQITRGQDVGIIQVPPQGDVQVVQRVAEPDVGEAQLARRLFFPVKTPAEPGVYRLRCHIYYRQNLVQSRLVTAHVGQEPPAAQNALVSEVDYTLSKTLDGRQLEGMGHTDLSLMLNENDSNTHGFRYFGKNEFKQDVALGEGELNTSIKMARAVLRRASWGDEEEFTDDKPYRYDGVRDLAQLQHDLILFAQRGYRFFADMIVPLAGEDGDPWEIMDWLLPPGQIQFASKRSARLVLPLAMMYDYPLNDGKDLSDFSLCDTFTKALQAGTPLAETACFQGHCPNYEDDLIVCPSGFWGFRHSIGLPVTTNAAPDAPTEIPTGDKPSMAVSIYTDFALWNGHEKKLRALDVGWDIAKTRDDSLDLLKRTEAQAVYFYCHGGLVKGLPFLKVGPEGDDRLVANNLLSKRIRWRKIRPLVFINGCHTTALSPESTLDFVSTFVGISHAAGVIGTEITIFEEIATTFAETFFQLFLNKRQTVGEAVRGARLAMLQDWNPLGLVYIPYVPPGLKLV